MTEQKVIAQKRSEYFRFISVIIAFLFFAAFMVFMYFTETEEPDSYIWLIVAAVFAAVALIPLIILIREKRLPEVLIYLENGVLHFYNGYECRPEDILDISSTYDSADNAVLNSGKIIIYTNKGKIVCRRIKDLAYATTAVMTFKYGRVYTTEELKIKMSRRAGL